MEAIRENQEAYLAELKGWLKSTKGEKLEEMVDFFHARLESYEEHMEIWKEAYCYMAEQVKHYLPEGGRILDLGCGTGLELEEIYKLLPEVPVVGIDLAEPMLEKLRGKFPGKDLNLICADYFQQELGEERFDLALSVESLHHFKQEKKLGLYRKLWAALRPGGVFLLADYIACCEEEETLLMAECEERRRQEGIPEGQFVHFDTPLTLEHEKEVLVQAGFSEAREITCIEGATFILARK